MRTRKHINYTAIFIILITSLSNISYAEYKDFYRPPKETFLANAKKEMSIAEQIKLADSYYDKKDYNNAIKYFKLAATNGNDYAQLNLGYSYLRVNKYKKAVYWFKKSAEQGNLNAKHALGVRYKEGGGVKKDYDKAIYFLKQVANTGNIFAQYSLGNAYRSKGDLIKAKYWYQKSSKREYLLGGDKLKEINNRIKKIIKDKINFAQLSFNKNDYNTAIIHLKSASELGSSIAMNNIGVLYENGFIKTKERHKEAIKWYKKAAEKGLTVAQYNLGSIYQYATDSFDSDLDLALYWYRQAANQGYKDAREKVSDLENPLFQIGQGIRNIIVENETETIEFLDEHGEKIVAGAIVGATIYGANELSVDDECFRPNDDCDGYQLKKHKNFYGRLKRHISSYKPPLGVCDGDKALAKYLNSISEYFSYAVGGAVTIALGADPQILVDLGDLRSALDLDGHC